MDDPGTPFRAGTGTPEIFALDAPHQAWLNISMEPDYLENRLRRSIADTTARLAEIKTEVRDLVNRRNTLEEEYTQLEKRLSSDKQSLLQLLSQAVDLQRKAFELLEDGDLFTYSEDGLQEGYGEEEPERSFATSVGSGSMPNIPETEELALSRKIRRKRTPSDDVFEGTEE